MNISRDNTKCKQINFTASGFLSAEAFGLCVESVFVTFSKNRASMKTMVYNRDKKVANFREFSFPKFKPKININLIGIYVLSSEEKSGGKERGIHQKDG